MSFAEMFAQYNTESSQEEIRESNLEESQVGAEEILVVTDETTTELEEAIEEVAEAVNDQEQVAAGTDVLLDAVESLESAVAMIQDARLQGQRINGTAMKIWVNGVVDSMEARQIPATVYEDLVTSFGDSFEADSYSDYSPEAEEKAEGMMTKIWNMIKAAFARARDFIARLIAWFGKSADSVEKAGRKLLKAVEDKKGKKADKNAKVRANAYGELMVGSTLNAVDAVDKVDGVFTVISNECTAMYDVAVVAAKSLESSGDKKAVIKKAGKDTSDSLAKIAKSVTGMAAGGSKEWEMTVESNSERFWNEGKVSYKLKTKELTKTTPGEVDVMSLDQLKQLANNIIDLAKTVRSESDNAKRTQGKLNIQFGTNAKGERDNLADQRIVARTISSTVAASSAVRGKIASSVLAIGKKAYVFGMANVRMYK